MNAALLYRRRQPWMFWLAFACAAAIHVGAVVLAKNKSEKITLQDVTPPGADVEFVDTEPELAPPYETITPPPAEFSPDEQTFVEENRAPQTVRPRKKTRITFVTRGVPVWFSSVKASAMYAPRPIYPYEARRQRMTGSGSALLSVDPVVGNVTHVRITRSCGSVILDNATVDALRRWRFRPGSALSVEVPITYTLTGASY
jgi:TonB family C-terminal domain